jgi:hypothetical protein
MVGTADWIICELIRVYHSPSLEEAPDVESATDASEAALLEDVQELGLKRRGHVPISSRNTVPPWASSSRPFFCALASGKALRSCPNSSGSGPRRLSAPERREFRDGSGGTVGTVPLLISCGCLRRSGRAISELTGCNWNI